MKLVGPHLPAVLEDGDANLFVDGASFEGCRFTSIDLSGATAQSVSLDEVLLERMQFTQAKLERLSVRDAMFKDCNFAAAQCADIALLRVTLNSGRMSGWDCSKGTSQDVTFTNCKLDMTNFRFAKLTRVRFIGCVLTDADFLGAELRDVSFDDCLLERTEFAQSKMKDVDLRSSQLIDIKGWQSLKGATIDTMQLMSAAPYLAAEMGIKVVD